MLMMRSGLVAALLLVGCVNLEDPAPSQTTRLVVHGILDTQSSRQTVLVYRARTGLPSAVEDDGISEDEPIANAQVSITDPDGTTWFAGRFLTQSGECCIPGIYIFPRSPTGGLVVTPGGTYTLRIRTPAGEEVTGTTTVPRAAPVATNSPIIFFPRRDTLRLAWPRVPGAASYEVLILSHFDREYRAFADSSFTLAGTALTLAGDEIFSSGDDAVVVVSAVDANYYDYYRSQSDPFAGAAPSHLTGAMGVFGSIEPILQMQLRIR
jgi:hypothetical protein